MYLKNSMCPTRCRTRWRCPARPPAAAALTTSSTERLWPRWMTSGARGLDQAAHDVDRGVVAVEEARGGDEPHVMNRLPERCVHGTARNPANWGTGS